LPQLIGKTGDGYVDIAARLAEDLPSLRTTREPARHDGASPNADGRACARNLGARSADVGHLVQ
jgi:hypothetical protein